MRQQEYATLPSQKTFETDYQTLWRGIEAALGNHRVTKRDPESVIPKDWEKLKERTLETDWIYSQSRDKYQEYSIGGVPKRQLLQMRYQINLITRRRLGGIDVFVVMNEELQAISNDGTPLGYSSVPADSSRANEFLDKIQQSILSLPPTVSEQELSSLK